MESTKLNLIFVSLIVSVFLLFSSTFCAQISLDTDTFNILECKPPSDPIILIHDQGTIDLPHKPNQNCSWVFTKNGTASGVEAFLFLDTIRLGKNDSLAIFSSDKDNKTTLIGNITESLDSVLLFTGTLENIRIDLVTSGDTSPRLFHFSLYQLEPKATLPVGNELELTLFPLDDKYSPKNVKAEWSLTLSLPSSNTQDNLVASVGSNTGVNLQFGSTNFIDSSPDYIGNKNIQMKLTVNNITAKNNKLEISIYLVNSMCSSFIQLDSNNPTTTISVPSENLTNSVDVRCLWIVQASDLKSQLNILFDSKDIVLPPGNHFVIRKGNRESSPVIADISELNYNEIRSNIYNSLFDSSSLFITYEAFKVSGEHPHFDVSVSSIPNFIKDSGSVSISTSDKTPTRFLFKSKTSKASLTAKAILPLTSDLNIYDGPILTDDSLLLCLKAGDLLPSQIWSRTNILVLIFVSPPKNLDFTLASSDTVLGSTAKQSKGSLVLLGDQLDCGASYYWLIPPYHASNNITVKSLVVSSLFLEKGSAFVIQQVALSNDHVFVTNGAVSEETENLPNLYLSTKVSHNLVYTRSKNCDRNAITLLQASVGPISYNEQKSIQVTEKITIKSSSYPNNYPLTEWNMTAALGTFNSSSPLLYITPEDIDLQADHVLEFGDGSSFFKFTKNDLSGDMVTKVKPSVNFYRYFNSKPNNQRTIGSPLSGRGYNISIEPLACGGILKNESGTLNLVSSSATGNCTWIIQVPKTDEKDAINILNFSFPENFKDIQIYDSNSKRNNRMVNLTSLTKDSYLNSTSETIIVVYSPHKTGTVELSWSTLTCTDLCVGPVRRCILPAERCNGFNDCGDNSDELHCNGTSPLPPKVRIETRGVPSLVVVFVIIPMAMIVGIICTIMMPRVMARLRGGQYQEFREYADVS